MSNMLDCQSSVQDTEMQKQEAIDFFGSQIAVARALGITKQAVQAWPDEIPEGRAYQLQVVTNGALKVARDKTEAA